ncbi:AMP-binding protein [Humitalea sp. 24SJ18S-53]|uniref:AMP-binding protein n=1 Tax=Humitalea sp. 24SJ18S-53 TaxID=3422307 RepID=UPI003D66FE50
MQPEGFIGRFADMARAEPDRVFARFDGAVLTFGALHQASDALASGLRSAGVARGDRVAVMLRNSPTALSLLLALAKAGIVWVPVNVQLRGAGLRYILDHAAPVALIADDDLMALAQDCGATLPALLWTEAEVTHLPHSAPWAEAPPWAADLFSISYTSGTTGPPKGVLVTHRMLRLAGEGARLVSDAQDGDVFFMWEPLYHIGGSQLMVLPLLRRVVLHMVSRFSASRFWPDVIASGATQIHFLGGILQILMKQPASPQDRAHAVRIAWGGGCPPEIWTAFEQRFGLRIRECYGMTEASSFTTFNDRGVIGSVGRAMPWFDVAVLAPPGERGEIIVSSPHPLALTPGYFRNPEATSMTLREGRLHTGDLGAWDADGNLIFHGRITDSVRVKGENVSAWEVEHVAAAHPAVEDCAMIGVASDVGEHDIKLFVQPRPGATLDPEGLWDWLATRLATYQRPRYIAFVDAFERTPSQRITKHSLPKDAACWDRLSLAKEPAR